MLTNPAKLLLVDDKPANLLALEAVLDTDAYKLLFAHSGEEALALLQQHRDIALILLDVQMPGLDGFEVSKRIKAMPDCREIPVILITAVHTDNPFVIKGYQAGAIDYFAKPFNPEILKLKVGIYVSFRQKAALLKEKERRIRESEEILRAGRKLSAIVESLPVGVVIMDGDGRVCHANDEGLRLGGLFEHAEDSSGGDFAERAARNARLLKAIEAPMIGALKTGQSMHTEIPQTAGSDGTPKSITTFVSPLRGRYGEIVGAAAVMQDVTERKKTRVDLENHIRQLVSPAVD